MAQNFKAFSFVGVHFIAATLIAFAGEAAAQATPRAKAKAPENHKLVKQAVSGSYFVATPLKEEYDRLVERLRLLKADIDNGRTTGTAALKELGQLQTELDRLRAEIEAKMVFVPVAQTQNETDTVTFDLGTERCLLITANDVRIVGWDEPNVKCELQKTVLSADGKPDGAELRGIKLIHRHGADTQKVGRTLAQVEADEAKFLASDAGQKLTQPGRDARRRFIDDIVFSWAHMADFQGKEIDMLDIEGLTHEQGNRQIMMEIKYDKGGSMSSEWRRHAKLTVYVPKCNHVAISCGGVQNLGMIDVQNLKASLVLWSGGTHKTAANEPFQVRSLDGSLRVKQVPLDLIDGVTGNVNITATVDLANRGTTHGSAGIVGTRQPPLPCVCRNVSGDFVGWFGRVDVQLESIQGRIDVRNEFGDTKLTVTERPCQAAHRIVSEAGRVELSLSRKEWGDFPVWASTQAGTFRCTLPQDFLEDFSIGTADDDGAQRSWVGLRRARGRVPSFNVNDFRALAARPKSALAGKEREPGFDLISRGGMVVVDVQP